MGICVLFSQSCSTLCDSKDCSMPGSSVCGILQAKLLQWGAIPFSRNLPDQGIKPRSPVLQADSLLSEPPVQFSSVQSLSRVLLFGTPWISTPGLPVHHQLPEFTQTHVHRVSDAIQPSYSLSSPSPPVPNPSQHQSLFQWVNSSHEVAKVLEFQL